MNWEMANRFGEDFVNALKSLMWEDYSKDNKKEMLLAHKHMLKKGGWFADSFKALNDATIEDMELILCLQNENVPKKVSRYAANRFLKEGKDDSLKNLIFEDFSWLMEFAKSIDDVEWYNTLLELEVEYSGN